MFGVADVFDEAVLQGKWRPHPSAPQSSAMRQVWVEVGTTADSGDMEENSVHNSVTVSAEDADAFIGAGAVVVRSFVPLFLKV